MSPELPPALRGRDIVCVGFADWDTDQWTNQQHLMSRLARGNRILFVESLGLRRPQAAQRDFGRLVRRLRRGLAPPRVVDGVRVVAPLVLPLHGVPAARALNDRLLPRIVGRATRRIRMKDPILWAYVPQAEALLNTLEPSFVLYHCVDDIAAQKGVDAASFRAAEKRFAQRADLVVASAPALATRMRGLAERVLEAPNVADTDLFAAVLEPGPIDPALAALPEPRLVFMGAVVRTKLDFELLAELAALRPHWSIALVGALGAGDPSTRLSSLTGATNVHVLGPRPYRKLPDVLRGAAVGLIPYSINELTRSVFPMKVYEYLAAGLPVLATPLPSLAGIEEITFAASASDAVDRLDHILADDTPGRRRERSRRAAGHSWEARIQEIAGEMDKIESSRARP